MEPDFPCLADEIAEPCRDMNIKATAFTESKKLYYTWVLITIELVKYDGPKSQEVLPSIIFS